MAVHGGGQFLMSEVPLYSRGAVPLGGGARSGALYAWKPVEIGPRCVFCTLQPSLDAAYIQGYLAPHEKYGVFLRGGFLDIFKKKGMLPSWGS